MALEDLKARRARIQKLIKETVIKSRHKREIPFISNLVTYLPHYLNSYFNKLPAKFGVNIKMGSVLIHQHPYVKWPTMNKDCAPATKTKIELGDLLLVSRRKHSDGNISFRGLMYQSKRNKQAKYKHDNPHQDYLYSNWPEFEYTSKELAGNKRKLTGPRLAECAKIMILNEDLHSLTEDECRKLYRYHLVNSFRPTTPHTGIPFTQELEDFLFGEAGRSIKIDVPTGNRNWDKIIEDILEFTATRSTGVSNIKKAAMSAGLSVSALRGQALSEFLTTETGSNSNNPAFTPEPPRDPHGLHIMTFDIEDAQGKDSD